MKNNNFRLTVLLAVKFYIIFVYSNVLYQPAFTLRFTLLSVSFCCFITIILNWFLKIQRIHSERSYIVGSWKKMRHCVFYYKIHAGKQLWNSLLNVPLIHFVFPLWFKFLNSSRNNKRKKNWRILVVVFKWRHRGIISFSFDVILLCAIEKLLGCYVVLIKFWRILCFIS